ncbi:biogenesis of lysosome-related organelles complex 1 subunit 2-like [Hydractinia symbiolongicarpus]|uniref:biogenesis of lysosome-related organelles complex 1 subunit 2-like n=1 Tax=Hydractinia symbiolongicarpus TaxID=13093 RepID=UPI00254EF69F|nr:biogenesis of lysosome-related organelles complex 1 subunit 2-like [Hydractinia symbiolongicarpus]
MTTINVLATATNDINNNGNITNHYNNDDDDANRGNNNENYENNNNNDGDNNDDYNDTHKKIKVFSTKTTGNPFFNQLKVIIKDIISGYSRIETTMHSTAHIILYLANITGLFRILTSSVKKSSASELYYY